MYLSVYHELYTNIQICRRQKYLSYSPFPQHFTTSDPSLLENHLKDPQQSFPLKFIDFHHTLYDLPEHIMEDAVKTLRKKQR